MARTEPIVKFRQLLHESPNEFCIRTLKLLYVVPWDTSRAIDAHDTFKTFYKFEFSG
jgi:hypothetical protein